VKIPPGHEVHDKFVVCGLNGRDPVVYCGSSNLATGGEENNGDNLLEIHDQDIAAAFAIEALLLVDHYNFLDRYASTVKDARSPATRAATTRHRQAAGPGRRKPVARKVAGTHRKPAPATRASTRSPRRKGDTAGRVTAMPSPARKASPRARALH
jgi:hypothetical protein